MADLARLAGVSASTIDRVLNGRHPVREDTARRVLEAAEQIGFYATPLLRQRLKADVPRRRFGFLLQQKSTPFYRILGDALSAATQNCAAVRGTAVVQFMDDLTPGAVAENLVRLGDTVDAVAVVAADHPNVTAAIDRLRTKDVPVVALISDLTAASRAAYVGLDNRKAGRTAGWLMANMSRRPGPVAMMVGSHRYLCQENCEIGFRAYLREKAPDIVLLDTLTTLESERYAYEVTLELLRRAPDLGGLYVGGGGIEGVMKALAEGHDGRRIVTICHDITEETRAGLVQDLVHVVIAHPIETLAARTIDALVRHAPLSDGPDHPTQAVVPFDLYTAENV